MADPSRELLSAVSANKLEAVKAIIRKPGVNINAHGCLHKAIFFGHVAMARLLVEAGADVNMRGMATKDTPLVLSLMHSHPDIAVFLLERGADPNIPSGAGQLPIAYATTAEMIEKLLKYGADPNISANKCQSPLFKALYWPTRLKALLQAKANLNVVDKDGYTPLILAAKKGLDAAVQLLLQFGADVTICAPSGSSVYEVATKSSIQQILEVHRSGHFTTPPTTDLKKDSKVASAPMSPVIEVGKEEAGSDDYTTNRRFLFSTLFTSSKQGKSSDMTKEPVSEKSDFSPYSAVPAATTTDTPAAVTAASVIHTASASSINSHYRVDTAIPAAAIAVPDTNIYLSTDSQRIDSLEARIQELERVVERQSGLIENQGALIRTLLRAVNLESGLKVTET